MWTLTSKYSIVLCAYVYTDYSHYKIKNFIVLSEQTGREYEHRYVQQ